MDALHAIRGRPRRGFTLLELLVVVGIIAIIAALLMAGYARSQWMALRVACMNNLKQFAGADLCYYADNGVLPAMDSTVPSSIKVAHLTMMAGYLKTPVPSGPVVQWPKRINQPAWYNCPRARTSGYAEGPTLGGGVYTGYIYVGGIQDTAMVATGMATLPNPDHSAPSRNFTRGVLWADVLDEFPSADPRRFECFHTEVGHIYPDFVFPKTQLEGIHRAWSDGSVEWVPIERLNLSGPGSPDLQIRHILGNYYY